MKRSQKKTSQTAESKKKSEASKKGWITRRKNLQKQGQKKPSQVAKSRTMSSEKLKKLQKQEKIRVISRRKSQKKGKSLATDKPKYKSKPVRPTHRPSKRRASIRWLFFLFLNSDQLCELSKYQKNTIYACKILEISIFWGQL